VGVGRGARVALQSTVFHDNNGTRNRSQGFSGILPNFNESQKIPVLEGALRPLEGASNESRLKKQASVHALWGLSKTCLFLAVNGYWNSSRAISIY